MFHYETRLNKYRIIMKQTLIDRYDDFRGHSIISLSAGAENE